MMKHIVRGVVVPGRGRWAGKDLRVGGLQDSGCKACFECCVARI